MKPSKTGQDWMTFRQILEDSRSAAARQAWQRAKFASKLRHSVRASGHTRSGRLLGEVKPAAISRAIELASDEICVSIDCDQHIGLLSVGWAGRGRLHLPAHVELPIPQTTREMECVHAVQTRVA